MDKWKRMAAVNRFKKVVFADEVYKEKPMAAKKFNLYLNKKELDGFVDYVNRLNNIRTVQNGNSLFVLVNDVPIIEVILDIEDHPLADTQFQKQIDKFMDLLDREAPKVSAPESIQQAQEAIQALDSLPYVMSVKTRHAFDANENHGGGFWLDGILAYEDTFTGDGLRAKFEILFEFKLNVEVTVMINKKKIAEFDSRSYASAINKLIQSLPNYINALAHNKAMDIANHVDVVSGPFKGYKGKIESYEANKVNIGLNIFGRYTVVALEYGDIRPVSDNWEDYERKRKQKNNDDWQDKPTAVRPPIADLFRPN